MTEIIETKNIEDQLKEDWLDETSYEVGQAMGAHESYEQVKLAYELEGTTGIERWLEAYSPKTMEEWEEYRERTKGETFPWDAVTTPKS